MVYKGLSGFFFFFKAISQKCPRISKLKGLGGVLCKTEEWGAIRRKRENEGGSTKDCCQPFTTKPTLLNTYFLSIDY